MLFFAILAMVGCKPAVKAAYGIKKPKLEDNRSIRDYLVQKGIDTSYVYTFNSLQSFALASSMEFLNIPDATFFNRQGYYVPYKEPGVDCNASADKFLLDMAGFTKTQPDASRTMGSLVSLLKMPENKKQNLAEINVFITWTVYAGKLNKQKAFEWIKLIEKAKQKGISINYYLVNCDFQRSWNIPPDIQRELGIAN
jgi:hypothetical protein